MSRRLTLIALASAPALVAGCSTTQNAGAEQSKPDAPGATLASDAPAPLEPSTDQPGLSPGEQAPDVALVNVEGDTVHLGELYDDGVTVVTFYRGAWCPFCTKALTGWEDRIDDLRAAGAQFVAISPEATPNVRTSIDKVNASYTVLSDPQGEAMRRFRVAFEVDQQTKDQYRGYGIDLTSWNASSRWELPAPATFVVDRNGTIRYSYADWNYRTRADPEQVIQAVRGIN